MLARGALCRLTADSSKTSPHDFPQLARLVQRALPIRNATNASSAARILWRARAVALHARRSMATTATAVKPTATVKKAVKPAAAIKAAPKTATKTAASATKAKPKAAAKKTTAKKTTAKKSAAKKKPAAKKKAAAKKAAPKKRVKKVLTEEQKAKAEIRQLRKTALKEPVTRNSLSAFNAYIAANSTKGQGQAGTRERLVMLAKSFKELTPAEIERYNHLANERTAAKRAEYKAWVESHTPDEIRLANNARRQLRKKMVNTRKVGYPARTEKLVDERIPKSPVSAYIRFASERHASGDFKGIPVTKTATLISTEWKNLNDSEKQKYEDLTKAARARHTSGMSANAAA